MQKPKRMQTLYGIYNTVLNGALCAIGMDTKTVSKVVAIAGHTEDGREVAAGQTLPP